MAANDRMMPRRGPAIPGRGRGRGPVKPGPVKPKPSKGKNPKLPYRSKDEGFAPKGRPAPGPKRPRPTGPDKRDSGFGPKKRPQPVKPAPRGGGIRDLLFRKQKQLDVSPQAREARGEVSIMRRPKLNDQKMQKGSGTSLNNEKMRKDTFPMKQKLNDMMSRKPGRITKPVMPRRGGR